MVITLGAFFICDSLGNILQQLLVVGRFNAFNVCLLHFLLNFVPPLSISSALLVLCKRAPLLCLLPLAKLDAHANPNDQRDCDHHGDCCIPCQFPPVDAFLQELRAHWTELMARLDTPSKWMSLRCNHSRCTAEVKGSLHHAIHAGKE